MKKTLLILRKNYELGISITNTYPESCFIDYMKALISGDHYQLMPKKIRVRELQTDRKSCRGKTKQVS